MPSPFPGMDPYLEEPVGWTDIHYRLIVRLADSLGPQLRPHYVAKVGERVYVATLFEDAPPDPRKARAPDVALVETGVGGRRQGAPDPEGASYVDVLVPMPQTIREPFVEIRDLRKGSEVVTAIEVLSPTNKIAGDGRERYLEKRRQVLESDANLVEVDLLRAGPRMPVLTAPSSFDYSILVSAAHTRARARLYTFSIRQPIPPVYIPLRPGEAQPLMELGPILNEVYDLTGADLTINYRLPPDPPLQDEDAAWADALLREKGLG